MTERLYIEAIRDAMYVEMARDERVFVLGEDVGLKGGVFGATTGLQKEFGEDRLIDTPLAESGIVGVAIGAAAAGMVPIAEIQFADFIMPAVNQIISEAARFRYRSNNDWHCPIVIRAPYGGGVHGALYHSQCIEAMFTHIPGLKVVAPSTPSDAKGMLAAAIRDPDPVLYLEHKALYRRIRGEVPDGEHVVPFSQVAVRREGDDITVLSYGYTMHLVLEAAVELQKEGYSAHCVDLRSLRPLDETAILEAVRKTGKVLIVHEDNKMMGFGSEIAAIVAEQALFDLDAPIMRLAGPEVPAGPFNLVLEEAYMPSVEKCLGAMRQLARF